MTARGLTSSSKSESTLVDKVDLRGEKKVGLEDCGEREAGEGWVRESLTQIGEVEMSLEMGDVVAGLRKSKKINFLDR